MRAHELDRGYQTKTTKSNSVSVRLACSNGDCTFFVTGNAQSNGSAVLGSFNEEHLGDGKDLRKRALPSALFRPLVPGLDGLHGQKRRGDSAQVMHVFMDSLFTEPWNVDEGICQGKHWWD